MERNTRLSISPLGLFLILGGLAGCTGVVPGLDEDRDGFAVPEDCDDGNAWVYPNSHEMEIPGDGTDQDCDGQDICMDLNCDAWPDLVITNQYDSSGGPVTQSFVYYGSEDGHSSDNREEFSTKGASSSEIADLNQDGYLEIVFANSTDGDRTDISSSIYWGSYSGFSASDVTWLATEGAAHVLAQDLNKDEYLDLIFSNRTDGEGSAEQNYDLLSSIYWGADGGFTEENSTGLSTLGASHAAVGDFDGDDRIDVAFAHSYLTTTSPVYLNSEEGLSEDLSQMLSTNQAKGTVAADLNEDGFTDLIFANFCGGFDCESLIYWGSATGLSEDNITELPTIAATAVTSADLNQDGHLDLVFVNSLDEEGTPEGESTIYWGTSSGFHWGNRTGIPTMGGTGVAIGDLDEDSWLDIVVSSIEGADDEPASTRVYWGSSDLFQSGAYDELDAFAASSVTITPGHRASY
jgi:hypothetical protein